ncbi:MAG TPA: ABC transporter permease [Candidatus Limnocylindrales bacterium]|nr:ABC transporter permease [Candidatus Limnocylindrales bacterium]
MFFRLLFESFRRQKRRKSVALLAIALGMSIATAMIAMGNDVGDKINEDLRANGGNLLVTPVEDTLDVNLGGVNLKPASEGAYIAESDLPKMKGIFWGHNIKGFVPFLSSPETISVQGRAIKVALIGTYFSQKLKYGDEEFTTGARTVNGWWKVTGAWPQDYSAWPQDHPPEVLAGSKLAQESGLAPGSEIELLGRKLRVSGILNTGGAEDRAVVAPLHIVQELLGKPNKVRRVIVSALTKPEDAFGRHDPNTLTPADRDRWYCSPYANSIALQIGEVLPNVRVEQIRQVEQNQGKILSSISGMMLLLTLAAMLAAALAVSAAMAATILERRHEVGLMKSMGASNGSVATLFLTEAGLLAVAGGVIGFFAGAVLAHRIGQTIFGSAITVQPIVLAVVVCAALLVTFAGSAGAVRKAMQFDPAVVLRGDA